MTKPVQIINNYWLKETLLNGNPILDKFYKEDLIRMINILKDENQKYKEVINKALKLNEKIINMRYQGFSYEQYKPYLLRQQNILKEVEHE